MSKGQLPKAYLRLDPLIDSHPDWEAMVLLMLWANRQPRRGYFKSLDVVKKLLGRKRLEACIARRDLARQGDGTFHLVGWEEWQEGDFTVGERMRRYRNKHVTGAVTNGVTLPSPPSEALGSKTLDVRSKEIPVDPPSSSQQGADDDGDRDGTDPAEKPLLLDAARCPDCHATDTLRRGKGDGGWFCGTKLGGCNAQFRLDDPAVLVQLGTHARASITTRVARAPAAANGPVAGRRPTAAETTAATVQAAFAERDAKRR